MVNIQIDGLDAAFHALADPTRRAILARLALGEAQVGELAEPFAISLPAISRHLKVLEGAGLIRRTVEGRVHRLQLAPERLASARDWIETYRRLWQEQFDRLANYLDGLPEPHPTDTTEPDEDPQP